MVVQCRSGKASTASRFRARRYRVNDVAAAVGPIGNSGAVQVAPVPPQLPSGTVAPPTESKAGNECGNECFGLLKRKSRKGVSSTDLRAHRHQSTSVEVGASSPGSVEIAILAQALAGIGLRPQ